MVVAGCVDSGTTWNTMILSLYLFRALTLVSGEGTWSSKRSAKTRPGQRSVYADQICSIVTFYKTWSVNCREDDGGANCPHSMSFDPQKIMLLNVVNR